MRGWLAHMRCYDILSAKSLDLSLRDAYQRDTRTWMDSVKTLRAEKDLRVRLRRASVF